MRAHASLCELMQAVSPCKFRLSLLYEGTQTKTASSMQVCAIIKMIIIILTIIIIIIIIITIIMTVGVKVDTRQRTKLQKNCVKSISK